MDDPIVQYTYRHFFLTNSVVMFFMAYFHGIMEKNIYALFSIGVLFLLDTVPFFTRREKYVLTLICILFPFTVINMFFHLIDVFSYFNFMYNSYKMLDLQNYEFCIEEVKRTQSLHRFLDSISYVSIQSECIICMTNDNNYLSQLDCGHVFHKSCIKKWILQKSPPTCPVCRRNITIPESINDFELIIY